MIIVMSYDVLCEHGSVTIIMLPLLVSYSHCLNGGSTLYIIIARLVIVKSQLLDSAKKNNQVTAHHLGAAVVSHHFPEVAQ